MAKTKEVSKLDTLKKTLEDSLQLAKDCYSEKPTNEMYSIITDIELTLKEAHKIK